MSHTHYNSRHSTFQLILPLPAHLLPSYPIPDLLRYCVLCELYCWRHLGSLAAHQLAKREGEQP